MDVSASSQAASWQRPRAPGPRAPSRASTVGSNARSVSSNNSHIQPASPGQSFSHPQRFHSTASAGSPRSSTRPTPQLSREASAELARPPTMSTFLQERLQKERRAESEKLGSSTSSRHNFDLGASVDLARAVNDKSFRASDFEPQRPQSSAGMDSGKKRGLGVKEMEQVVSTLHKQNFDLKLELYHRRERQTKLEERLDVLEAEKQGMEKLNEKLLADVEKRDKAIEEAVTMIVELETKIDQLLNERSMVKHVESQGFYASTDGFDEYDESVATSSTADVSQHQERSKTPTMSRMPSFLSDHNATTKNLRTVYVGNRASIMSLRRISDSLSEANNAMMDGLTSPTLSILSESSFLSVYGQKGGDTTVIPDFDEPFALSGFDGSSPAVAQEPAALSSKPYYDDGHGIASKQRDCKTPAQTQPPGDTLNKDSAAQRLETTDSDSARPDVPAHQTLRNGASQSDRNSLQSSPARGCTKDEKRAALRNVMTDASGGARLHDQALPPTPDTISSSTLQRLKSSNDNLSVRRQTSDERQSIRGPDAQPAHQQQGAEKEGGVSLQQKEPLRNSDSSRPFADAIPSYDPYGAKKIPRPRSAGDTTTASHRRHDSWDSEDSDTKSLQSSLDIWMRESTKAPRMSGRVSPDLFGFPTGMTNGRWASSALFDPKQSLGAMPSTDYMHDLLSLREALLSRNLAPPPPPDRRSSLHGHVRSVSAMPTDGKPLAAGGTWQPPPPPEAAAAASSASIRRNSDAADMRRANTRTPVPSGEQKKGGSSSNSGANNYPPTSWQQGSRAGLKGLFRRSLTGSGGGGVGPPLPAVSSPTKSECGSCAQEAETQPPSSSWLSRSSAAAAVAAAAAAANSNDCDRSGATPPPIMLNPRQTARRSSVAAAPGSLNGVVMDSQSIQADAISQHSMPSSQSAGGAQLTGAAAAAAAPGPAGRRKWLPGFSRNKA